MIYLSAILTVHGNLKYLNITQGFQFPATVYLHHNSFEANTVAFTPLNLFDNLSLLCRYTLIQNTLSNQQIPIIGKNHFLFYLFHRQLGHQ